MFMRRRLIAALLAVTFAAATHAQIAGRVVEDVDATEHSGYVDINVLFACGLRYLSHLPSSEGEALRIRTVPQPDCALGGDGLAPVILSSNTRDYIRAITLDRPITAEVDIAVRWTRVEKYLVIPTGDGRGLRIRLLRTGETRGRVFLGADPGPTASYAINLESSREPFTDAQVAAAAQATGVRAYISEYMLEQEKWYRLRIGPFVSEADAKRTLTNARNNYPKAWLAIADDESLTAIGNPDAVRNAVVPNGRANENLMPQDIERILKQAKTAFRKKDYATAIPLLTKLLEQPEFPQRAEAQELIGLARERSKQIAHAKAEYEEYLRRYPNGPAADRVRQRLHALDLAARKSVPGLSGGDDESAWKIYGGFSQLYRRDNSRFENAATTTDVVSQNALLTDFALVARRHGERFDFSTRIGASYIKTFVDNGLGDQTRVSSAVVELSDRQLGWRTRFGRQSVSGSGIYGNFDGLYVDYQWLPRLRVSVAGGSPVETTGSTYNGDRQFVALASNFGPFAGAWDFSTYIVSQQFQGETDRRAFGTEIHYFVPGRTLIGLIDYDIYYRELNNILLIGTLELPGRWTLNANYDHRQSPALSIRNALIGQSTDSLSDLLLIYSRDEIDQFARDRSATTDLYSISASVAAGEHWQWTFDTSRVAIGETVESGGVQAIPESPPEMAYSVLAIGNGVFTDGDLQVLALRYQDGQNVKTSSLGLSTRWPIVGAWRAGPRLRVDRREMVFDGSQQWIYVPSLRVDYQFKRAWFEFEAGMELSKRDVGTSFEKTTRNYFSLGYRWQF